MNKKSRLAHTGQLFKVNEETVQWRMKYGHDAKRVGQGYIVSLEMTPCRRKRGMTVSLSGMCLSLLSVLNKLKTEA